ncbi:MAG: GreA/GreB family elongation factor, partial [Candidatus Eisenbacteria bacterium]|nr:GreA/GreB family elongation factor [Candidatus Eisenbacteria bacterium]
TIAPDVWHAALGLATLIESTSREQVRKLALTMMLPEGVLASKLAQETPDEAIVERFGFLLRRWRSSERYLQPVLRVLRQVGLEQEVEDFRTEQVAKTNLILQSHAQTIDYSGTFMTRATFERLRKDLERMNFELKTTVAQAIQKARELGDLRENAEFAAAKQKQADYMERIGSLTTRLGDARMIDDLKLPEGEVGPGVVVTLEDVNSREITNYWLLGEGDDFFGGDVLSYASPLGREMLGHKVGERISIITDSGPKELLIKETHPKLPEVQEVRAN